MKVNWVTRQFIQAKYDVEQLPSWLRPQGDGMSHRQKEGKICSECGKERERCRVYTQDPDGNLVYICRQCWRDLEYDRYLYEHLQQRTGDEVV